MQHLHGGHTALSVEMARVLTYIEITGDNNVISRINKMTTHTTNTPLPTASFRARIGEAFAAFAGWFEAYMERSARTDIIRGLEAKSDAELQKMGIRRDQIVYHVFSDKFYF